MKAKTAAFDRLEQSLLILQTVAHLSPTPNLRVTYALTTDLAHMHLVSRNMAI